MIPKIVSICTANGEYLCTGYENEMKISKPQERSYEENSFTPLVILIFLSVRSHVLCWNTLTFLFLNNFLIFVISVKLYLQTISIDKDKSVKSLSSVLEAKRGSFRNLLEGVLPANRSSLTPYEQKNPLLTLSSPSDPITKKKSLIITGRKIMQCSDNELSYSSNSSLLSEKPSKEVIATCTAKKRRIEMFNQKPFIVKKAQLSNHLASHSVKRDTSKLPDGTNMETHIGSAMLLKDDAPKKDAEFLSQKGKGVQSNPVPCSEKETRGSAFLVQVKYFDNTNDSVVSTFSVISNSKNCLSW